MKKVFISCILSTLFMSFDIEDTEQMISILERPEIAVVNSEYANNRAPLLPMHFIKLPVGSIMPEGWLGRYLELQKNGLTGHLGEISAWLEKENNAWINKEGDHGWEEVPYWLKGYCSLAYTLNDEKMIKEASVWMEAVLNSSREDGFFGPENKENGKPELWAHMIMLRCLQTYYEYTKDERVISLMTRYFKWQLSLPDELFLDGYWENSRGGDNLLSVFWLYNHTGDNFLLELAEKIHRNTADWTNPSRLPNWHNVNVAQCFREPATYYLLNKDSSMLASSYNVHSLVRRIFGQVPGGMFGSDENCRMGYIDPRQGVETCGMVEQMASDEIMLAITGDPFWAENCEDVAFNTFPAAVMPDFKALRYITAPNHVVSDSKNHHPGIDNSGPFLAMNPFSSRCCQHNHSQGWPYYSEHLVMATPDNGAALVLYASNTTKMKVSGGNDITIVEETNYPFQENIRVTLKMKKNNIEFPLYLRIPSWTDNAKVSINGDDIDLKLEAGKYMRIMRKWNNGDKLEICYPMSLSLRTWTTNKNSVSVDYGPLTFSLKIDEEYIKCDSKKTAIGDSRWQKNANAEDWPSYEIYPKSDWNYALVLDKEDMIKNFEVIHKKWPNDDFPFSHQGCPIEIRTIGRKIPSWKIDQYGLCHELPDNGVNMDKKENITLIPMGAARLRISAFPCAYE